MTIYYVTILFLFLLSLLELNYNLAAGTRKILFFITYLLLVVQVGLRWESGTDWIPYLTHFESISNFESASPLLNGLEYGYNLFAWISKLITPDYSFFLLINAVIYYLLIFKSFQRYSPSMYVSLLLFYTLTMGLMGSNRQLLALAICLYALRYLIENKPVWFFLLVLLAANFHTTAIIFVVYYFINREIKPYTVMLILATSLIVGKSQLPYAMFTSVGDLIGGNVGDKVVRYLKEANDTLSDYKLSLAGLAKRLLFLAFFYYNQKDLSEKLPYYTIMLNGYLLGMAFYFLFADSLLVMISRGSVFFNVMEPLLLASQLYLFKIEENKTIIVSALMVLSIFFFFKSIATYPDLFVPYKGVFINTDYSRVMH